MRHSPPLKLLAPILNLVVSGCLYGSDPLNLPTCPTAEREPTGDLVADILGGWSQMSGTEPGDHPLSKFGTTEDVHRVWLFNEDGTGHMWYGAQREDGNIDGDTGFSWRVEDGKLIVDDLRSATVQIRSASRSLIEPVDGRPATQGLGWTRCNPEVPETNS